MNQYGGIERVRRVADQDIQRRAVREVAKELRDLLAKDLGARAVAHADVDDHVALAVVQPNALGAWQVLEALRVRVVLEHRDGRRGRRRRRRAGRLDGDVGLGRERRHRVRVVRVGARTSPAKVGRDRIALGLVRVIDAHAVMGRRMAYARDRVGTIESTEWQRSVVVRVDGRSRARARISSIGGHDRNARSLDERWRWCWCWCGCWWCSVYTDRRRGRGRGRGRGGCHASGTSESNVVSSVGRQRKALHLARWLLRGSTKALGARVSDVDDRPHENTSHAINEEVVVDAPQRQRQQQQQQRRRR